MSKYYQTSKKKFISENNKEKWDERFRQATARCDYCLEFKIGIERKSKDKEVKDKHLLSFLTGNENETDFICNTCIAYSFFRKIVSIVKKNRVFYYIGGEKKYNELVESWNDKSRFKEIEGEIKRIVSVPKLFGQERCCLIVNEEEINTYRSIDLLEEKTKKKRCMFVCEIVDNELELRKIFPLEASIRKNRDEMQNEPNFSLSRKDEIKKFFNDLVDLVDDYRKQNDKQEAKKRQ